MIKTTLILIGSFYDHDLFTYWQTPASNYAIQVRGVARLSVKPVQTHLSIVTRYNLWEGHTCIHKSVFVCGMASYSKLYQHGV